MIPLHDNVSAASILSQAVVYRTGSEAIDSLLDGGLAKGQLLEVCGPPACLKADIVHAIIKSAITNGDHIVVYGLRGEISLSRYKEPQCNENITDSQLASNVVHYVALSSVTDLIVALNRLAGWLAQHPKIGLVVLDGVSSIVDFSSVGKPIFLWRRLCQILSQACALHHAAAIYTTSLSTKLVTDNGDVASFNTVSKAFLAPQSGSAAPEKGRRIMLSRLSPSTVLAYLHPHVAGRTAVHICEDDFSQLNFVLGTM